MELKEIKYFLAIAESGNMSAAAKKLYITQPALSHFLNKLEKSLDVTLFRKKNNNALVLTEAGKLLLESAQKIYEIQQDMLRQLSGYQNNSSQTITIGLSSEHATQLLTNTLPLLYERYPGIHVDIMHHTVVELRQLVKNGQLDFAYSAYDTKDPGLDYIPFDVLNIDVLLPASNPLSVRGTAVPGDSMPQISLKELEKEPFLLLKKNTILRNVEDAYFAANQFHPYIQMELLSIASGISLIHDMQQHIGLFPRGYSPYRDGSVMYLALNPPLPYEVGVYYKKNVPLTRLMKDCISLMKHCFLLQNKEV